MGVPPLPPLNLNSTTASGVDAGPVAFDNSGFSVVYGGSGIPSWVMAAGLLVAAVWLLRRK